MNIKAIKLNFLLTSPLSHFGDEPAGTMQTLRRQKFKVGDNYEDIPVFSANAFRGILRTLVMSDYFERLDMGVGSISQSLYYTFFNGGSLKSGGTENLALKEDIKKYCPALVLLGAAFGSIMTEGKMKCGILKPVCRELNVYNRSQSDKSIYDGMLSTTFYTRKDRLKSNSENTNDITADNKEVMQMKYESEVFSAGTELESEVKIEFANELEYSCACHMLKLLQEAGHLGGKSSVGHGSFNLTTSESLESMSKQYVDYISEHKNDIVSWISEMEKVLNA